MTLGERITGRLAELGQSQAWLARQVGISQPAINSLIRNPGQGTKHLHEIARHLQTTVDFLQGRTDDPGEGALPLPSADSLVEQLDAVLLREVQVGLSMGGGSHVEDWPVVRLVPFSRSWLRGLTSSPAAELVVSRGDGDSMMPTILDQDLVIIDLAQTTPRQQDRIWAISYGGLGMIKRLRQLPDGSLQINSDNAAVSPILAFDNEASIVGRVVGVIRKI